MARGPDAGALVERALNASALAAGVPLTIEEASAVRWASATFAGARHILEVAMQDAEPARRWLGTLGDAEMPMRGHLLADCAVVATRHHAGRLTARVEALTVEAV